MIRRFMRAALIRVSQQAWNLALWTGDLADRFAPRAKNVVKVPRLYVVSRKTRGGLN